VLARAFPVSIGSRGPVSGRKVRALATATAEDASQSDAEEQRQDERQNSFDEAGKHNWYSFDIAL
jgi:hypothetical protein